MKTKVYYFTKDYSTPFGVVKKGDSLTGRIFSFTPKGKVQFDFFEKTDPAKAEAGEGIFSIAESDLKNFATDVEPTSTTKSSTATTTSDDTKKAEEVKVKKGFSSWSNTKKTLVVGGGLLAVGLAVWYFVIRKK